MNFCVDSMKLSEVHKKSKHIWPGERAGIEWGGYTRGQQKITYKIISRVLYAYIKIR